MQYYIKKNNLLDHFVIHTFGQLRAKFAINTCRLNNFNFEMRFPKVFLNFLIVLFYLYFFFKIKGSNY